MTDTKTELETYARILWRPESIIEIRPLPTKSGKREWILAKDIADSVPRMIAENEKGANMYAGVLPRTKDGGGKSEHVETGHTLWVDMDHCEPADARNIIADFGLPEPSMIVSSGHGAHVFWALIGDVPAEQIGSIECGLIAALQQHPEAKKYIDQGAKDIARILRLPGFLNHKPPKRTASIFSHDESIRYDVSAFNQYAEAHEQKAKSTPVSSGTANARLPNEITSPQTSGRSSDSATIENEEKLRRYIAACPGAGPGSRTTSAFRIAAFGARDCNLPDDIVTRAVEAWDMIANSPTIASEYGPDHIRGIVANAKKYGRNAQGSAIAMPYIQADKTVSEHIYNGVDLSEIIERKERAMRELPFPDELLNVPGFVGDVVRYNLETAHKPQPVLALAGALALQAVLASRKTKTPEGTHPNIYLCCLGVSGSGKDHARKINKKILNECGGELLHVEGAKSGSAFCNILEDRPAILFQLDEFGRLLEGSANPERNPHIHDLLTKMLNLYSSAGGVYVTDTYADKQRGGKRIENPCASVYATTVPESLYAALTARNIVDGFLSRIMIFDSDGHNPKRRLLRHETPIPEGIIERARFWIELNPGGGNIDSNPECNLAIESDEAFDVRMSYRDMEYEESEKDKSGMASCLWGRGGENAQKLSLLYALSAMPTGTVVTKTAAEWGHRLSEWLVRRMMALVDSNVAENEFHRETQKILKTVKANGGTIPHRDLMRKMKINKRRMDAAIEYLHDAELIRILDVETGGRLKRVYESI